MIRNAMKIWSAAGAVAALSALAAGQHEGHNAAQPTPAAAAPAAQPAAPAAPTWTDPEFGKIAAMATGSWKTTAPVAGADGAKSDIIINIAPVHLDAVPDTMYVEIARADSPQNPYRQTLWQLYRNKGKLRVKTIEFRRSKGEMGCVVGMWAAPDTFPQYTQNDLITTLDIELEPKGPGYAGKTPHPYPTSSGGAVEMTSDVTLTPDTIETADRGFGPDGKVVWGAAEGQKYSFKKFDPGVTVKRLDGGLVLVDFAHPTGDIEIQQADKTTVQYSGYLADGFKFDSSRDKPQPFTFTQGTLIPGWNVGLIGATKGTVRRLIIPAALAYGDRGAGRTIPPGSPLYFEIEVLAIDRPVPPAPEQPKLDAPTGQPAQPGQPGGQPAKPGQPGQPAPQPKKPE